VPRPLAAGGVCALALVAGALLGFSAARPSNVVYLGNSFYGELKVVDVGNLRLFLINGVDNGLVDRRTFRSVAPYMAYFAYLPAARPPALPARLLALAPASAPRTSHLARRVATDSA